MADEVRISNPFSPYRDGSHVLVVTDQDEATWEIVQSIIPNGKNDFPNAKKKVTVFPNERNAVIYMKAGEGLLKGEVLGKMTKRLTGLLIPVGSLRRIESLCLPDGTICWRETLQKEEGD